MYMCTCKISLRHRYLMMRVECEINIDHAKGRREIESMGTIMRVTIGRS